MRSNALTVTVERSCRASVVPGQTLIETLRAHYRDMERDKEVGAVGWRCAAVFFWVNAVSVLYTSLTCTVRHLVGEVLGQDAWTVYWAKVVMAFGFVELAGNWLCFNFYTSFHKVTDDRPHLSKTLWDDHPLEVAKKVEDVEMLGCGRRLDPRRLPWKHCVKCQMEQPPRAHHCKICQKCVLKRDHHCFILGSCVGYFNQRYFIILSFYLFIASLLALTLSYSYLRVHFSPQAAGWDYVLPFTAFSWLFKARFDLLTVLLISHWYIFTWMAPMSLAFFTMNMCAVYSGRTMREFVRNIPLRITNSRSDNFRSVFGDFWLVNFILPAIILFKQPEDGTEWPGIFRMPARRAGREAPDKTHRS